MTYKGFKIYYGDGSVVSSRDVSWEDAPNNNVQVVVVFYEETYPIKKDGEWVEEPFRLLLAAQDYYWQWGCGSAAVAPANTPMKLGLWMESQDFRAIYNRALNDMEF